MNLRQAVALYETVKSMVNSRFSIGAVSLFAAQTFALGHFMFVFKNQDKFQRHPTACVCGHWTHRKLW